MTAPPAGRPRPGPVTAVLVVTLGLAALVAALADGAAPAEEAPAPAAGAPPGEASERRGTVDVAEPAEPSADEGAAAGVAEPGETRLPVLGLPTFTVLDPTYDSGLYTSLRIAPDGLPALSYYDDTNGALMYARCHDAVCVDATSTVVEGDGVTGLSTSLAYGPDGLPVISFYDLDTGAVRLVWCRDGGCGGTTEVLVDASVPDVTRTALTIAPDGHAEVAYVSGATTDLAALHLARCDRGSCVRERIDGPGIGEYVASARQDDDLVIVYRDEDARLLRLARCDTAGCRVTTPDATVGGGLQPSVALGGDGTAVIAHLDLSGRALRLVRCSDRPCSRTDTAVLADTAGAGFFPALALRPDGAPTVAYYDEGTKALWVASCADAGCSEVERHLVDALGVVGLHTAMVVGGDGIPVIAYHDQSSHHLKVVGCANARCEAPVEAATLGGGASTFVDDRGRAGVVYRSPRPRDIRVARCTDASCTRTEVVPADSRVFVGLHGSASTTVDGSPLVTFLDAGSADLRLGSCPDTPCPYLRARDLATDGNVGAFAVQSLDQDLLAVAYLDRTRRQVRLLTCTAPSCADPVDVALADVPAGAGPVALDHLAGRPVLVRQEPSTGRLLLVSCRDAACRRHDDAVIADRAAPLPVQLAVGGDGRLWTLHRDAVSGALRITACADAACRQPASVEVAPDGVEASLALVDDLPAVAFLAEGRGLVVAACDDPACDRPVDRVLSTDVGLTTSIASGTSDEVLVGTLDLRSRDPVLLRCGDVRCGEVERIQMTTRARR